MIGQKGIIPIKTGVTYSAGPCLATAVELDPQAQFVIVLLGCKDMDCRWVETQKLAKWATHRIQKVRNFEQSQASTPDNRILERIRHL